MCYNNPFQARISLAWSCIMYAIVALVYIGNAVIQEKQCVLPSTPGVTHGVTMKVSSTSFAIKTL